LNNLEKEDNVPKYLIEAVREILNQLGEVKVQTRLI